MYRICEIDERYMMSAENLPNKTKNSSKASSRWMTNQVQSGKVLSEMIKINVKFDSFNKTYEFCNDRNRSVNMISGLKSENYEMHFFIESKL